MELEQLLLEIEKYTDKNFALAKHGKVYFLATDKEIPVDLLLYHRAPEDGLYQIVEQICDGRHGCEVGAPAKKCMMDGIVSNLTCAVYGFYQAESFMLSASLVVAILKENKIVT